MAENINTEAVPEDLTKAAGPVQATMTLPHGYYGEDGALRWWDAGSIITDPQEIADLVARNAPIQVGADIGLDM